VVTIRPYHEVDERAVTDLWRTVFPDAPSWNRPQEDIRLKLSVQRELFLIAIADGVLAGTAMAGFDGHRGWVYYVAVHPDRRRRGIGTELMRHVEQGLARLGCTKLNLQVRGTDREAVAFYERLGYAVEERVSMSKRLAVAGEGRS
jgi:ribosomal protein S18 acetylase RimI-like enzyme